MKERKYLKSRAWKFTINNPTDQDRDRVIQLSRNTDGVTCSSEIGESGTPHLQGTVDFGRGKSKNFPYVKTCLGKRAWIGRCGGDTDIKRSEGYCSKEGGSLLVTKNKRR